MAKQDIPVPSMTGFGADEGRHGSVAWRWDIRSVNGKGLDVRLRLPPGYEALEPRLRERIGARLTRGNVSVSLNVAREGGGTAITINETALAQVLAIAERLSARGGFAPLSIDGLLALRGVIEVGEGIEPQAAVEARHTAMLASFERALEQLVESRRAEGRRLAPVIEEHLVSIEALVAQIAASPARAPEAILARLKEQVARLLDTGAPLDETRLHQEAALLAARADVEEELQRLRAHVAAARELMAGGKPAGRRLDFLAQEFNREANTTCSKANDIETTRAGLALKAVIEQMREQIQNIE
ncbi:MAG: YicC/YloC family endoribonuclease [Hyphomicrobiaceae bacterium]